MNGDCGRFDLWLEGGGDAGAEWARAHAATCARCRAALELEEALAAPPGAATGAAFTERVMLRVRDTERALAAARLPADEAPAPWWLAAPAEPAAALALAAAALLTWQADTLWAWALALGARLGALRLPEAAALLHGLGVPGPAGQALVLAALATLAPLAWLGSMALSGWVERSFGPPARRA